MNGSVLLLLPMILPFIFGLIIGFQKEEKQRNILVFIAMAVEAALVWYLCSGEMQTFVLWRISDRLALVYKTDGLARFFGLPHQYHLADCGSVLHGIYEA